MLSIIVCTYNRDRFLEKTLQLLDPDQSSLVGKGAYEVVLIDNNSTDRTADICKAFAVQVEGRLSFRYVLETKQGLSNARNRGIEESKGEWLVFLDDDAFIQLDYIVNLQKHIEAHPEMVAFGGKIDPLYESGVEPSWMSKWSYSWVSAIDKGPEVCHFEGKEYPIGANMGVRTDIARKVQGFNPNLGRTGKNTMGGEEKDFFNKIRSLITTSHATLSTPAPCILYLPDVQVQHCIPESRTTREFIARLGDGVGTSERQRTLDQGKSSYCKRLFAEAVKWCGTLVLWCQYLLLGQKQKGDVLVLFRWHVTSKLIAGS